MSRTERSIEAAGDWRVLLPPGWITLPTEKDAAAKAISRLIDSALQGKPRDELIDVRIQLDRALREQARKAEKAGAKYLHALIHPVRGVPVSASLITSQVASRDPDELAAVLSTMLGEATGVVENGYTDVGDLGALRRVRRAMTPIDPADPSTEHMATFVDYIVALDDSRVLVMAFSTGTEPIHEELIALFDAIAATLHRPEGRRGRSGVTPVPIADSP